MSFNKLCQNLADSDNKYFFTISVRQGLGGSSSEFLMRLQSRSWLWLRLSQQELGAGESLFKIVHSHYGW